LYGNLSLSYFVFAFFGLSEWGARGVELLELVLGVALAAVSAARAAAPRHVEPLTIRHYLTETDWTGTV